MADVSESAVNKFRKLASKKGRINPDFLEEPVDILFDKLHLINNGYLTNAAMMLFSEDPERWQLGAYVKIGYFESDSDLRYQDEVRGSLIEIVDKITDLVYLKYMKAQISYEGMQRIERYFVPEAAFREVLLNALCHSQYNYGVPIQISVYNDRMYIANCGQLPENWTIENLFRKHASKPYNPNIANVFYLAGFIESWVRGIEKVCEACKADGLPNPEYEINPGDIMVKFSAPSERIITVTEKVTENKTDNLTVTEQKILELLNEDPGYTYNDLSLRLNISVKSIAYNIKKLKTSGIIERIGSDTRGYWKIHLG